MEKHYQDMQIVEQGIVFLSDDKTIQFCNETFALMVGMTRKELVGLSWREQTQHDDASDQEVSLWFFYHKDLQAFKTISRMHRKDGSIFYVKVEFHRIYDNNDKLMFRVGVYTEISEEAYLDAL